MREQRTSRPAGERGMTLMEAMIAIVVLVIGVVAVAEVFTVGTQTMGNSQYTFIAKTKAEEAVESVFAARDDQSLLWAQIQNVKGATGTDGGVFIDGACPVNDPGPDGLVNTADDQPGTMEYIVLPGPDGVYGTADDVKLPLNRLTREIAIRPVTGLLVGGTTVQLRTLTVTVYDNSTASASPGCGSNGTGGFKGNILFQIQTYISPFT